VTESDVSVTYAPDESAKWPDEDDYPTITTRRALRIRGCEPTA